MGTVTLAKYSDITTLNTQITGINSQLSNIYDQIGDVNSLTSPQTGDIIKAINSINTLSYYSEIETGDDLNDYYTPGIYLGRANIINNISNIPEDLYYYDGNSVLEYPNFKLIVSELGTGMIRQQIINGDFANTAHTGKQWTRFYDVSNDTWTNWYTYLIAQMSDNGYKYVAPTRTSKTYDWGINGMKIRRDQDHSFNFLVLNEHLTLGSSVTTGSGGGLGIRDSNNDLIGFYIAGTNSDGDAYLQMYAQNSSNSLNRLTLTKGEDGTNTVDVTSPAAWRAGIQAAPNPTIETIASNVSKSIANSSNTNHSKVTFTPGVWLLTVRGSYASSSVGRRAIFLSTSTNGGALSSRYNTNQQATNGATTVLGWTAVISVTSASTYYINGYQNSGSALNLILFAEKTKLGDA